MRTIYKETLELRHETQIKQLPDKAKVVKVNIQNGNICFWFDCDSNEPLVHRCFEVRGTGHEVTENSIYVGTCQTTNGFFVWHVFEV